MPLQLQLSRPELEKYITEQVKAGRFPSPEALVEDALERMIESESGLTEEELDKLAIAEKQVEQGQVTDWSEASKSLRKKYLGE
jgi:Arc/MetJ-type ribon-helix-helix transcriptional regulator